VLSFSLSLDSLPSKGAVSGEVLTVRCVAECDAQVCSKCFDTSLTASSISRLLAPLSESIVNRCIPDWGCLYSFR
jgi:hypothetical protein